MVIIESYCSAVLFILNLIMTSPLKVPKDTVFSRNFSLNCGGNLVDLSTPKVMGIVNLTPDSFFAESRHNRSDSLIERVGQMLEDGATFIDLGAMSTRPGAPEISEREEKDRLITPLKLLVETFPNALFSIDTYRSTIAKEAIDHGAHLINDISGGTFDHEMFATIAQLNVPYVLMHTLDKPSSMQHNPHYNNVVTEIFQFFSKQLTQLRELGVMDVILDPGFGFGKTLEHNYSILKHLNEFSHLNAPILAGISRKGMIWKLLETSPEEALNGTTTSNTIALLNGAQILRVHDVKEAMESIKIVDFYQKQ